MTVTTCADQWDALVARLGGEELGTERIRKCADLVMQDADDLRFRDPVKARRSAALLTPVERLLRLVRDVLWHLRLESSDHEGHFEARQLPCLKNLRDLLNLVLNDEGRVLSYLDRLRLDARVSEVRLYYDLTDARDHAHRAWAWFNAAQRLTNLEAAVAAAPWRHDVGVRFLRASMLYQQVQGLLHQNPKRARAATELLTELLTAIPQRSMPTGHYYRAAEVILGRGLEDNYRRELLRRARHPLALAFATLPPERLLDRLGISHLLAWDAKSVEARACAYRLADCGVRLTTRDTAHESLTPFTRRQVKTAVDNLSRFRDLLAVPAAPGGSCSFDAYQALLPSEIRKAMAAGNWQDVYHLLEREEQQVSLQSQLYWRVLRSWIGRKLQAGTCPADETPFLDEVLALLGSDHRDDLTVGRLIEVGLVCRRMRARGSLEVDQAVREFHRVLEVAVLFQDHQGLVDNLPIEGHMDFVAELGGLEEERVALEEVEAYFEKALCVKGRRGEAVSFFGVLEEMCSLAPAASNAAKVRLDAIKDAWHWNNVREWAEPYQLATQRGQVQPESAGALVKTFFGAVRDVETLLHVLPTISLETERLGWLGSLAFCGFNFCRVFRSIGRVENAREWCARGIEWADEAIAIVERYGRGRDWREFYRAVEARIRLEKFRSQVGMVTDSEEPSWQIVRRLRGRMLTADLQDIAGIRSPRRRGRPVVKAERTLCEVISPEWCRSFEAARPLEEFGDILSALQRIKSLYSGWSDEGEGLRIIGATDPANDDLAVDADEQADAETAQDLLGNVGDYLASHLGEENAAIVEYLTHPGADHRSQRRLTPKEEVRNGWGTVAFVIRAQGGRLFGRPFFLGAPNSMVRGLLLRDGRGFGGLPSELPRWPSEPPERHPGSLAELGRRLFPAELLNELRSVEKLYLCPHRHLFQVPLHALVGHDGTAIFHRWKVSYSLKTEHIVNLLRSRREEGEGDRGTTPWVLVDGADPEIAKLHTVVARHVGRHENQWGLQGVDVEGLLARAARARRAIILCHGQVDENQAGRARLRLWGGGRLLTEDLYRAVVDYGGTDWCLIACDAASANVGMQTAPGIALGLVANGARSVTSCFFRVTPQTASAFIEALLPRWESDGVGAFTEACRELAAEPTDLAGWALSASFVSYGLFG